MGTRSHTIFGAWAIYATSRKYWERPRRTSVGNRLRHPPSYSLAMNGPYYIRGLDNLRCYVPVMYLCGSPCISVCVSLGSGSSDPWPKAHGARRGPARIVAGPGYNTFCGTTGVELDSRRDGHAIGQSGSTDPYSTEAIGTLPGMLQLYYFATRGPAGGSVIPCIHPSHALRPEDRTESVLSVILRSSRKS